MSLSLTLTTVSRREAERLARLVIEKKLAACGNIAPVRSFYWWKGSLRDEEEALILFKTTRAKARELKSFLEKEHPYDTPEVVQVEPRFTNQKYLSWVLESVAG